MINFPRPSNLTTPPLIPGFEARLLFDRNPTLLLYEVYTNATGMMVVLAEWPEIAHQLQAKHAVQAMYKAGNAVGAIPTTPQY